jgi:hypothetical protein
MNLIFYSTHIIIMMKSMSIRWTGRVSAYGRHEKCLQFFYSNNLMTREHFGDGGIDG